MYIANHRVWLLPSVALLLVVTALFGFSTAANAQQASGDFCVEGIVIDWEEEPLADVAVELEYPVLSGGTAFTTTTSATDDNDDLDEGEFEFKDLDELADPAVPGIYTATVTLPGPDWVGVTATTFSFSIGDQEDDCVRIRFKLKQQVLVTVYKIDADHNLLNDWTIDAIPGKGNLFAEAQDEDTGDVDKGFAMGMVQFTLTPGVWIFRERQPEPDEGEHPDPFQPIVPKTGEMEVDVQPITNGDPPYILVFKNDLIDNGCVTIRKFGLCTGEETDPSFCQDTQLNDGTSGYGAAGWGFKLVRKDGSVARQGVTDAEGYITFEDLPLGPYTIVEEERPGWDNVTYTKLNVDIMSQADQMIDTGLACLQVPVLNQQDDSGYCIEGYKLDANGLYGLPGWEIKIDPVDEGGYDPSNQFTDGLGYYKFEFPDNDYRVPGASFEICEDDDVDGWLPHTPTCQIVTLPSHPSAECVQALDFINQQVGHSESEAMDHNGHGGNNGSAPKSCSQTYTVKPGQGLFDIGASFGVSAQAMVYANPNVMGPNYTIYVGQTLCIP